MTDRPPLVETTVASPWGPVRIAAGADGVVAIESLGTAEGVRGGPRPARLRADDRPWSTPTAVPRSSPPRPATPSGRCSTASAPTPAPCPSTSSDRPEWDRLVLEAVRAIPRGPTAGLRRDRASDRAPGRGAGGRRRRGPEPGGAARSPATGSSPATARSAATGPRRGAAARPRSRSSATLLALEGSRCAAAGCRRVDSVAVHAGAWRGTRRVVGLYPYPRHHGATPMESYDETDDTDVAGHKRSSRRGSGDGPAGLDGKRAAAAARSTARTTTPRATCSPADRRRRARPCRASRPTTRTATDLDPP